MATDPQLSLPLVSTCPKCNTEYLAADGVETIDGTFCPDCAEEYSECESCHKMVKGDDIHKTKDGYDLCPECLDDAYKCENCEELFYDNSDLTKINGDYYCEHCRDELFSCCDHCETWVCSDEIRVTDSGDCLCDSCYSDRYTRCHECDCEISQDDSYYHEGTDHTYCSDCLPAEDNEDSSGVHDHGYKPDPIFQFSTTEPRNTKNALFFGIELEMETMGRADISEGVETIPTWCYAKHDGSLSHGFEMVSHPITWSALDERKSAINGVLSSLTKQGFRSYDTDTCGMHAHISKGLFTTCHLLKFLNLFYQNAQFVKTISQRKGDTMEQWATLSGDEAHPNAIKYKAKNKYGNASRYCAINLQNSNTVEIRVFRGTLNALSFWKNLQFVHAAFYYTKDAPISDVSVNGFISWISGKAQYRELIAFLCDKHLAPDSAMPKANARETTQTMNEAA